MLCATLPAGEEISLSLPDKNTMNLREARIFTTWPRETRYCATGAVSEGYFSLCSVCGLPRTSVRGIWTANTCRVLRVIVKSFYLYRASSLFSDGDLAYPQLIGNVSLWSSRLSGKAGIFFTPSDERTRWYLIHRDTLSNKTV